MRYTMGALGVLVLAAAIAAPAQAQQVSLEARHLFQRLDVIRPHVPEPVMREFEALVRSWDRTAWDDRQALERTLLALESMMPSQIRDTFKSALNKEGDAKRSAIKETFAKLAKGGEIAAADLRPSVVVVIVGGNVEARKGFDDWCEATPNIWNEIRPMGTYVKSVKSPWGADREKWMGEFMTGHSLRGLVKDGQVSKFRSPTVCDLFRFISKVGARDCWVVTYGDESNIIYDYLEFQANFQDKYKPTALTSFKLKQIDSYVQDHILSERQDGKSPFDIQNQLGTSLTPGKLHLDIDFSNAEVQRFLRDVIAENGGQLTNSEGFLHRLGVRLLKDPIMAPRLAIIRFGGIPGLASMRRLQDKKALMTARMQDTDQAAYNLWRAFRSNPFYRNLGHFILVGEFGGAIFVGPKVKRGEEVSKNYFNGQYLPTIARLLGYEHKEFVKPCQQKPSKPPIDEVFVE